jgi:hypothetical protein
MKRARSKKMRLQALAFAAAVGGMVGGQVCNLETDTLVVGRVS